MVTFLVVLGMFLAACLGFKIGQAWEQMKRDVP